MRLGYRIRDNYLRWCNIVHQVPIHKQAYATPYLVHILFDELLCVRQGWVGNCSVVVYVRDMYNGVLSLPQGLCV